MSATPSTEIDLAFCSTTLSNNLPNTLGGGGRSHLNRSGRKAVLGRKLEIDGEVNKLS